MIDGLCLSDVVKTSIEKVFSTTIFIEIAESVANLNVSIPTVIRGRKLDNNLGDGASEVSMKLDIGQKHLAKFSLQYRENSR